MMKFPRICLILLFLPCFPLFAGQGEGVQAILVTDAPSPVVAGKPFTATVVLNLEPGWHTYWQYPGDSGIPTRVQWHLPPGWMAGPLEFSVPDQFSEPGDMIIYGYEKQSLLRAVITPPKELPKNQTYDLTATVSWLACKELCVPGKAEVALKVLGPTDGSIDWETATVPKRVWPEVGPPPFPVLITKEADGFRINFSYSSSNLKAIAWKLYPDPGFPPAGDTTVGHVVPEANQLGFEFFIPWKGSAPFHALLVANEAGLRKAWWIGGATTGGKTTAGGSSSAKPPIAQAPAVHAVRWSILIAALFSGFLGGIILNLMPCVLPVISLKIFGFIAQAGESPGKIFRHGLAFATGIFVWFLGLGVLVIALKAGGKQVTWGAFQFQNPLFVIFLSVLVFLFALNLFGLFEVTLHGKASSSLDQKCSSGGYGASFFQGLFATLLATPCTAPFLGSALGFAFSQSPAVILAMFGAVAFGMSLPYLLLSARPGWRHHIPKPGAWMERLKQFMGFPLLATNLWLLWVLQNQRGSSAVLYLLLLFLILGFCAWIYGIIAGRAGSSKSSTLPILLVLLAGAVTSFLGLKILRLPPPEGLSVQGVQGQGVHGEGVAWVPYSPPALQALRDEGKAVFLDFTASWCLTCQFNERTAINTPAVKKLFADRGIVAMKGDWTNADPAITAALKSFGRVGVPLAVFYPQGKESSPVVLPELLTESIVINAIQGSIK